ncbi:YaiI/YqxD family protein [Fusibacter tunisiensis]|jgi:uncharacterized protein YaiI (UPF0178 family)|uniref:Uncharacterized protein YaiI (UPF0178 family) n=1 Tax=Fusibacter tunisiensis TaxID=1008308 RepID=A0ABS2MTX5_9FIRM|nr:DUF188 domain-containing protein [Fusibacter tunisiensis]MBM7562830.1 uncharacterized protein YaiI (UPF0178 family) [Fusibacter tunisiensis]
MRIWIDADGCPVVNQTIIIAKRLGISVTVVKNHAVSFESNYATVITVDVSRDAADYYIANHLETNDLVVTQDNGLAAMVLAKKGLCINQNGKEIHKNNIDFVLDSRHQGRVARLKNQRGPRHKKRTKADDQAFENGLLSIIESNVI